MSTIATLTALFRAKQLGRYDTKRGGVGCDYKYVLDELDELVGALPVDDFGSLKAMQIRDGWVDRGTLCLKTINGRWKCLVNIFKLGVAYELVPPELLVKLEAVPVLRRGQAPERDARPTPELADVLAYARHPEVPIVMRRLVLVIAATAARPSEIFNLRASMVDREASAIILGDHKTAKKIGAAKALPLSGVALKVITEQIEDRGIEWDSNKLVFVGSSGTGYNKDTFYRRHKRICERFKLQRFMVGRLRHMALTMATEAVGLDAASALAGHTNTAITATHYVSRSLARGRDASEVIGKHLEG